MDAAAKDPVIINNIIWHFIAVYKGFVFLYGDCICDHHFPGCGPVQVHE